jgi:SNF2 family DNA or RNA helicase
VLKVWSMNPVPPPPDPREEPNGWRSALLRALADPALAAFDGEASVADEQADWAAYGVAVALGQCRLFGVELADDDGSLSPSMGLAAARKWRAYLGEWVSAADEIPRLWLKAGGTLEVLELALEPLEQRMESWAAFVAIDEAYEEAQESAWPRRREFGELLDACLAGLDRFDEALHRHVEYLAVASRTALLGNWRKMLADEYRAAPPWWLDGTLERLDEQIADGDGWQPRRLRSAPSPGEGEPPLDFSGEAEVVRLVAEAHRLAAGHQVNPGFAIETSVIQPLPHQRIAVYRHMLPQARLRFLLADDAGAGKTIMAGLYVREMLSRRLLRRVLIVPPAGLVGNWQSELSKLFDLPFRIVEGRDARGGNPFTWEASDRVIVSVDTLAGEKMFGRLREPEVAPYDLVIFDEAHKLSASRNEGDLTINKTARYRLAEALAGAAVESDEDGENWALGWSCRHLLLLTATPHMGKDFPYYSLWRLLEPDALPAWDAFQHYPAEQRAQRFLRRTKEEMVDFDGRRIYPPRVSNTFSYDLTPGVGGEQDLYEQTTDYLRNQYSRAMRLNRSAVRLAMGIFQRRLASSTWALLRSFERRLAHLDGLLADLQKGKATVEEVARDQRKLDQMKDFFETTTGDDEEIPTRSREREENEENQDRALAGVADWALSRLVEERAHVVELLELARQVDGRGEQAKFDKLADLLRDDRYRGEKVLIFTEFRDTLEFLCRGLEGMGYAEQVARLHGGMDYRERQAQVEFFRRATGEGGARFLVATDAAGEGINLQFCWLLVNYDIPWNPARLEQRMGRVHRFGQKKDKVLVFNLVAGKTREGRVLETLLKKLERIREALRSDKVFDVVGRLFEGVSLRDFMERALLGEEGEVLDALGERLTEQEVERLGRQDKQLLNAEGDVARLLPEQRKEQEREDWRRLLPGFVRRFVENAAPRLGLRVEGELDQFFSLRDMSGPETPLRAALAGAGRGNKHALTLHRPEQANGHVFLRPGEPLFERLRLTFCERFGDEARRGGVFVDPEASRPYLFHLARVTVRRRGDESLAPLGREEVLESRLLGLVQDEAGEVRPCPLEQLLLLRGVGDVPAPWRSLAGRAAEAREKARQELRGQVREMAAGRRQSLRESLPERMKFVRHGYAYQDSELSERRAKLRQKAERGDPAAGTMLNRVKEQQRALAGLREGALRALAREPELIEPGDVSFLAHALVAPIAGVVGDEARRDEQVEEIAVGVARAWEAAAGAVVMDVSRPALARSAGLTDHPGFDLWSLRRDGRLAIEVKGRAEGGTVDLTENEWVQACNHRERYWLYVVLDCSTPFPRLLRIQDPFGKLIARARGGVRFDERQLLEAAEREVFGV